jgi:hypothetical protein
MKNLKSFGFTVFLAVSFAGNALAPSREEKGKGRVNEATEHQQQQHNQQLSECPQNQARLHALWQRERSIALKIEEDINHKTLRKINEFFHVLREQTFIGRNYFNDNFSIDEFEQYWLLYQTLEDIMTSFKDSSNNCILITLLNFPIDHLLACELAGRLWSLKDLLDIDEANKRIKDAFLFIAETAEKGFCYVDFSHLSPFYFFITEDIGKGSSVNTLKKLKLMLSSFGLPNDDLNSERSRNFIKLLIKYKIIKRSELLQLSQAHREKIRNAKCGAMAMLCRDQGCTEVNNDILKNMLTFDITGQNPDRSDEDLIWFLWKLLEDVEVEQAELAAYDFTQQAPSSNAMASSFCFTSGATSSSASD